MSRFKEILVVLTVISGCVGNICAEQKKSVSPFVLVGLNRQASVCYDADDDLVVSKVARLFVEDVKRVTGKNLDISTETGGAKEMLVVGTVRKNKLIQKLAFDRKIDVSVLEGEWERYIIQTVEKPFPNVERALVIAGSDRRGAAYGLLSLSERIGVSPWYWWADVPVERRQELVLDIPYCLSQSPTVKYRGIFLNDEDWGLTPWASKTFEKERGNIGPKTYAKVCELLLRLKANYLAPAMHPVSTAFNQIPENKLVADSFAIVMGSTHCEPLLFNTASEWDKKTMGEWDYGTNRKNIYEVLSRRVAENSPFENVYTLALRGLHDAAMGVGMPMKEKVRLLGEALDDQRKILASHLDKPLDCIPQAFTPYKEVLEIYLNGKSIMKHLNPYGYGFRMEKVLVHLEKGNNQIVMRVYNRFEKEISYILRPSENQTIYKQDLTLPEMSKKKNHKLTVRQTGLTSEHDDTGLSNLRIRLRRIAL